MAATHRAQVARIAVAVAALAVAVGGESSVGRALNRGGIERAAVSVSVTGVPAAIPLADTAERIAEQGAAEHPVAPRPHPHPAPRPVRPAPSPAPRPAPARPDAVAGVAQRAVLLGLPAALSADGGAVEVGYPDASSTLTLFEDFRCSNTRDFEQAQGATLARMAAAHQVLIRYVLESSLDQRLPGPGAVLATNAARAALDHGGFPLYHALLFANQPAEGVDGFTADRLLAIASAVPGLRGPDFDREVREVAHRDFVDQAQQAYTAAQVHFGTPSMVLDGQEVDLGVHRDLLYDPAALESFVRNSAARRS